jgi:hypothetical protein
MGLGFKENLKEQIFLNVEGWPKKSLKMPFLGAIVHFWAKRWLGKL